MNDNSNKSKFDEVMDRNASSISGLLVLGLAVGLVAALVKLVAWLLG